MRVLNEEGERLEREFRKNYGGCGCTCFQCAPCGYCVHPGNPLNLEESEDLWVWVDDEEPKEAPKVDVMDVTRRMFR